MARRPFDPGRIHVPPEELPPTAPTPDGGKAAARQGPLTVSQLTRLIKRVITEHLPPSLVVTGELSNVSRPSSGHVYFTLKDAGSELRCVMWRSAADRLRFDPQDGMEVLATGGVDVYEPRGQYQFYARKLEPKGIGELELAFRQLREKLEREGLFEPEHKQPLPEYPQRIAIVTSSTGAAIRDVIRTIARRFPCVTLLLHPVRVQGEGAAEEIARAVAAINRQAERLGGIDLMIVGRGGGSLEDLWAFNEEVVARAIFASRIPIISAVGHEVDVTISDLVADVRAATPTAAAEIAVPSLGEVVETLETISARVRRMMRHRLDLARRDLTAIERFERFRQPMAVVRRGEQQVDEATSRLTWGLSSRVQTLRRGLHDCELALRSIHPRAVLQERRRQLIEMAHRLRWVQGARNLRAERQLAAETQALRSASPRHAVARARDRLTHLAERLDRATTDRRRQILRELENLAVRLQASGHEAILRRGFSITRLRRGNRIVTDPSQVRSGDRVTTETAGGPFDSRVVDREQLDLFE
ncbi:MAG: exodeoxyribonuclease VII large subunit [Phycisphaerae bacterium]|nr:exodeoxyribonuclease VII large subunit [Phycisphaerae bacterium]